MHASKPLDRSIPRSERTGPFWPLGRPVALRAGHPSSLTASGLEEIFSSYYFPVPTCICSCCTKPRSGHTTTPSNHLAPSQKKTGPKWSCDGCSRPSPSSASFRYALVLPSSSLDGGQEGPANGSPGPALKGRGGIGRSTNWVHGPGLTARPLPGPQLASAQNITGLTTIPPPTEGGTGYVIGPSGTTPFYSGTSSHRPYSHRCLTGWPSPTAPSTFTPTASGPSPGAGTEVTITNASPTGLFSFTRPFSSVPPTGTITDSSAQAEATSLDSLQPTPDGLEVRLVHSPAPVESCSRVCFTVGAGRSAHGPDRLCQPGRAPRLGRHRLGRRRPHARPDPMNPSRHPSTMTAPTTDTPTPERDPTLTSILIRPPRRLRVSP